LAATYPDRTSLLLSEEVAISTIALQLEVPDSSLFSQWDSGQGFSFLSWALNGMTVLSWYLPVATVPYDAVDELFPPILPRRMVGPLLPFYGRRRAS
jgi:hypothetical protein